jgi:hypothetical protein
MLITSDDEIYRVDQVFLGPDRFRFPWRARYRAYGIFAVTFMAAQVVERQLGIPLGVWPVAFALLISVWITRTIGQYFDYDRTLKSLWIEMRLEISGPRRQTAVTRVAWSTLRLRAARRRRAALLATVYGANEPDTAKSESSIPSWWSQFRRRRAPLTTAAGAMPHTRPVPTSTSAVVNGAQEQHR